MDKLQIKKINRRLTPLYICVFFSGFVLWYATEKLFMRTIGFNDQTIALETVIFTAAMIILNTPVGILADRWSRKGVMVLGCGALITCSLIGGLSHNIVTYIVSACFWGLFYSCYSGISDSIIYDVLIEEKINTDNFKSFFGQFYIYEGLSLVLGSLINPLVTHFLGLRATYFLTIPFTVCAVIAIYYLKDPKVHKRGIATLLGRHIVDTLKAIIKSGRVFWIVFTMIMVFSFMRMIFEFNQLWYIALVVPLVFYGPAGALVLTSISSGGYLAKKLKSSSMAYLVVAIVLVSSFALLLKHRYLIVIAQTILETGCVGLNIVLSQYLHDSLPSKIRASSSSLVVTIGYIVFIPIALWFGKIANQSGIFKAAWLPIILLMVAVGGFGIVSSYRASSSSVDLV